MNENNQCLYAIVAPNLFDLPDEGPWYVAWQKPVWSDDDGYFWTTGDTFREVLKKKPENNEAPHKFAFPTEDAARSFAEGHHYLRNCKYIIKEISI